MPKILYEKSGNFFNKPEKAKNYPLSKKATMYELCTKPHPASKFKNLTSSNNKISHDFLACSSLQPKPP